MRARPDADIIAFVPADIGDFAEGWERAWNAHDLDALLGHFSDDVVFSSPVAAKLVEGSDGVVRGKAALRAYWAHALALIPDLRFSVVGAYAGVDVVVINYRNQRGQLVCEVLRFDGDTVVEGHGTYLTEALGDPSAAVGATTPSEDARLHD